MPRLLRWAVCAALFILPTAPALAQIGNSSLPLDIEADQVDVYDAERRILWRGRVNAAQGTSSIRADQVEVFYSGAGTGDGAGGWGDIDRIVATDNVFYVTPTQRARGDRGVYVLAEETITLTGDVVITQGENVITTNRFVTDLTTGNSSFSSAGDGARVRAVLVPERRESGNGGDAGNTSSDEPSEPQPSN